MTSPYDTRRYLTNFDSTRVGHIVTNVLVIGSGVAGARAAIEAAGYGPVILVTKRGFADSATEHAQGGIAAAIGPEDSPASHFEDTLRVGCGLNDRAAVETLVTEGPRRVEEVMGWGLAFDRDGGDLALGREAGHSRHRIVHAQGDRTGRELVAALRQRVVETDAIRVFEGCYLIDVMTRDGVCLGAVTFHRRFGHQLVWAKQTILATGGCGRIWRETTNPPVANGDGLAAAYRAGGLLRDMEMVQFHPTTLYIAGAGRALISEAVRGEGAYLVDRSGQRFMSSYHADAELAPRDIVSRAIHRHLRETRSNCVYLDVRHIRHFADRFPNIARRCGDFQVDVTRDLIPVRPSVHYMIGGVQVDLDGRSSVAALWCCGEVASNGVHGANRLASNSLLEGLVFGARSGLLAGRLASEDGSAASVERVTALTPPSHRAELDLSDINNSLRSVMWRNVGVERRGDRLGETCDLMAFWGHFTLDKTFNGPDGWTTQNKLTVARLIAMSARERDDSLGVHFRADAGDAPPPAPYHVCVSRDADHTRVARVPVVAD
ncbi:MAG: L-aspartate oxidase [Phycisphaerae bacterium]